MGVQLIEYERGVQHDVHDISVDSECSTECAADRGMAMHQKGAGRVPDGNRPAPFDLLTLVIASRFGEPPVW